MQEEATVPSSTPSEEEASLPNEINVTPINDATKFTPSSVFSSVYSPTNKDDIPALKEENPLKDEMPAKKEEMELPKVSSEPVNVPDFSAFDNETYDINK